MVSVPARFLFKRLLPFFVFFKLLYKWLLFFPEWVLFFLRKIKEKKREKIKRKKRIYFHNLSPQKSVRQSFKPNCFKCHPLSFFQKRRNLNMFFYSVSWCLSWVLLIQMKRCLDHSWQLLGENDDSWYEIKKTKLWEEGGTFHLNGASECCFYCSFGCMVLSMVLLLPYMGTAISFNVSRL